MDFELKQENRTDYAIITEKEKTEWRSVSNRLLIILTSHTWRVIILIFNFANYFVASIGYIFLQDELTDDMYYAMVLFDAMYFVDYVVNLILYFWKKAQVYLNKRPRKKWLLILDIFLAFPYSYIYEAATGRSHDDTIFLLLKSILVLRLIHFVMYFQEKMDAAGANHILDFLIQCAAFLLLLQQTAVCVFYLMAWRGTSEHTKKGWTKVATLRERFSNRMEHYMICLCFVLYNITQRSFGDIVPLDVPEKLLLIFIISIGFTMTTGILIGVLSFLFEKSFSRMATLRYQIHDIKKYLKNVKMKDRDKKRIKNYYRIFWEKKDGVHEISKYPQLPFSVYSEISVDINIGPLQRSTIFRDKEDAFLRAVSSVMKHEFYQSGEFVYHANVVKDKMIFVVSGTIDVLSDEDNESSIISFGQGTCLGESSLILTLPSKCSVKVACYTELQVLYRRNFYKLIDLFPQIFQEIRDDVIQRIAESKTKISAKKEILSINLRSYFSHYKSTSTIKTLKEKLRGHIPMDESEDIFLTMYKLSDGSLEIDAKKIFINSEFPWILQRDTSFYRTWDYLIISIVAFIALLYPYYLIFLKEYNNFIATCFEYIDIILMIDMVVILCTAIKEKTKIIKTFMDILRKRLTQPGFYLDFFSCIKFEAFCIPFAEEERVCNVFRLNRLLKCYRIPKLINHIDDKLIGHVVVLRLIKYLIFILISIYWFGALLYQVTCFDLICIEDGWFFTKLMKDLNQGLAFSYSRNRMLTSVYYSLFYVTSPSFKDILAYNIPDMVTGYTATLFGVFLMGYCVAELTATITHQRKIVTQYQENFFALLSFMKEKNMPKSIIHRVEKFFVLQWNYDKGVSMRGSLFYNANKHLQTMVDMAEKWDIIVNLPVLHGRNYDFLQRLVSDTTILVLPPNEHINYRGEISGILYVILEGYCIRQMAGPIETRIMGPKSYFGSISLFANVTTMTAMKSLTHVKMLCISHDSLWKCASMYPMVSNQLKETLKSLDLSEDIHKVPDTDHYEEECEIDELKGSIINVYSYCKDHNENYSAPFNKLSYMCWLKFVLLPICILPYGNFLKIWMTIRLVVASLVAILTPYDLVQYPYNPTLYKTLDYLDYVAYVDLYVMMFVGYYGPKNQLIMHPLKTAGHYVKGKFIIDFVFCFPWEVLVSQIEQLIEGKRATNLIEHNFIAMFRIIRVFQIYRLPQFFNYLSRDITRTGNIVQIAKFLPTIIIAINFCAAVLIVTTCTYYSQYDYEPHDVYNNNYVQPEGYMHHPVQPFTMFCKIQSWIDRSKFRNITDPFELYMVAIYFCSSSVTTCGFGDITPQYPNTLILTLVMIICGFLFFGYIYAKISSHKADWRTLQSETQGMVIEFKKFMMLEKVNKKLQEKVIDLLEYRWKRSRGAEPNVILANLNATLHEDAALSMYGQILSEVPILANVQTAFFRLIGKIIREMYYLREECIYEADDIVSKICIVYRGTVKITPKDGGKDVFMGRGGIFGNISSQSKRKISITVTSMSKVDVLAIDSHTFFTIVKKYPSVKEEVERAITNLDFIKSATEKNYDIYQEMENTMTERRESINCIRCLQIISCWKLFRQTIPPYSIIYTFFDVLCLVLAYINFIMVTYEFAFRHHSVFLLTKSIIIDTLFFIRLILTLHKSYEDDFGELVESNKKILEKYFEHKKFRRSIDILANIPFYYIAFLTEFDKDADPYLYFSAMRLVTVMRFLIYLDYYEEKSNQLLVNTPALKAMTTIVWVTMIIHFFACGWYMCACPLGYCIKDSWMTEYFPKKEEKAHIYVTCVYFMTGLFTAASNGDILPNTFTEQIYVTIVMMLANFLIGIFIGDIMNSLNSATLRRVNYERGITKLWLYLRNCNVSDYQMEKLKNYVEKLWTMSDGNQIPRLLPTLHFNTQYQLMLHIYGHHIKNSYIFKDVEEAFARQLSSFLKRNVYFPGNYIVKHGDSDKSMYFIHYGEVDILTIHPNLTETIHEVLQVGEVFGIMQGLYHGIPHHFSYRAKTTVHTVSLCLSDWEHLMDFFPASKEVIYAKAAAVYS